MTSPNPTSTTGSRVGSAHSVTLVLPMPAISAMYLKKQVRERHKDTISQYPPTFRVAEKVYPMQEFGVNEPHRLRLTRFAVSVYH